MQPHSRLLILICLTTLGCESRATVKERSRSKQNTEPSLNVRNVEAVRMVFHAIDYDERQVKLYQYLISVGERAFPAYEEILSFQGADPVDVSGVLGVLCEVKADRRRFLKHALSRLTDATDSVRRTAVVLLSQIGSPAEASPLVALLSDEEIGVVSRAAEALAAIGGSNEVVAMDVWLRGVSHRERSRLREHVQKCRDDLQNRLAAKKDPTK